MEHTQLLRVKKLKGGSIINIAARHNLREIQAEIGADSHIDPSRSHLNIILRGAGIAADVAREAVRLMEQGKVKRRKNEVLGLEMLVSLPASSGIDEQSFFRESVAWAEGFFEIPILSAVIHNDEAAPHCHVIMLPLFDGRMIGSALVGNKNRLLAMQGDFHAKVGQGYGLKRGEPVRRYSVSVRGTAADKVVSTLRREPNKLNDPAICDALRDELTERMPVGLMALLGLDLPEVKAPKVKTFVSIMIQNKPERKEKKPIGFNSNMPIGFVAAINAPKEQSLSCVGFQDNQLIVNPASAPITDECKDEFVRERESEQSPDNWDDSLGEFVMQPIKAEKLSPEIERMFNEIAVLKKKRSVA